MTGTAVAEKPRVRRYPLVGQCSCGHEVDVQTWAPAVPTQCLLAWCGQPIKLREAR